MFVSEAEASSGASDVMNGDRGERLLHESGRTGGTPGRAQRRRSRAPPLLHSGGPADHDR